MPFSVDHPGGILGAREVAYKSRLGRFTGRHGAVLGALRATLEPYGELPRPFWTRPDGSGQRLADVLHFIFFIDVHSFPYVFLRFSSSKSGS